MQQEKTRLRRNYHSDLIGELEPAATFEILLAQKNLNVPKQLLPILRWETAKHREILIENGHPARWNWLRAELLPPAVSKQTEDHA